MNYTGHQINNKPLAKLALGCMRFPSRESACDVIAEGVRHGVLYLDTAPAYCYRSAEENCEAWVGTAIKGMREQVILSAKCSTGNGGTEIGEYKPETGFSIITADQVRRQIEQSLRRLQVDKLDYYQLWAIHAPALFDEALKPGGWMEGVLKAKEEGLLDHIGITGHGDNDEVKRWIRSGYFTMLTIPFHIMDISRLEAIHEAYAKGIPVIAMNPLVGGLLGSASQPLADAMTTAGIESASEMALRFVAAFHGVTALSGMTTADEVRQNVAAISKPRWIEPEAQAIKQQFERLLGQADHVCTGCNYCAPCPQGLNIPEILKLRNYHHVLQLASAARTFGERYRWWGDSFKADKCLACGQCESRCPNGLPVSRLMADVMATMGAEITATA